MSDFYPHQLTGGEWLAARTRAGLFDEMGVGKTMTAIRGVQVANITQVLVVCPAVVLWNWRREWQAWDVGCDVQVLASSKDRVEPMREGATRRIVLTTHGLLLRPAVFDDQLLREQWGVLIVDEAHFFRSPTAQRTRALYALDAKQDPDGALVTHCDRVWLLTGTPMPNNAGELWTHFRGLWPERIAKSTGEPRTFHGFQKRYCHRRFDGFGWKVVGNIRERVPELRRKFDGIVLRRRKVDVLPQLPPRRYEQITVAPDKPVWEIEEITRVIGDNLESALRAAAGDVDDVSAAQSFRLLGDREEFARFRYLCAVAKVEPVADLLTMELESWLDKIVVFAHHTDAIKGLEAAMSKFGSISITGATPAKTRAALVERFQKDPDTRVACCQIIAAGTGATMTAASEVLFLEMSFVPGENAQAADRVHRIGQTRDVRVRFVALDGTLDVSLTNVLRNKTRMIREIMETPK